MGRSSAQKQVWALPPEKLQLIAEADSALLAENSDPAQDANRADRIQHLSRRDRKIVTRGEISTTQYLAGGATGTILGFGIGHIVQGRWAEKGWIFTAGELVTSSLFVGGLMECAMTSVANVLTGDEECDSSAMEFGAFALGALRIWEVIDLWAGPPIHNRKYRSLQSQLNQPGSFSFFLGPERREGIRLGMRYRF